jgi:hypothetical protein
MKILIYFSSTKIHNTFTLKHLSKIDAKTAPFFHLFLNQPLFVRLFSVPKPRLGQVEVALDVAKDFVVDHAFVP